MYYNHTTDEGEHPRFSRSFLDYPAGVRTERQRAEGGAVVEFILYDFKL
jgi:hypothetical protein